METIQVLRQITIPVNERSATYTDADWNLVTSGWRLITHCTAQLELPSATLPEGRFTPYREELLVHDLLGELVRSSRAPDQPTSFDISKRRGRFAR